MSLTFVPMIAGPPQLGALETDWIPAVGEMDSAIEELRGKIKAFASETVPQLVDVPDVQAWLVAWNAFVDDFKSFADGIWLDRWKRRSQILAARGRFNELVDWWKNLPGTVSTVNTPPYKPAQVDPGSDLKDIVRWAAIGLIAIAGISALAQLSPAIKGLLPKGGSR